MRIKKLIYLLVEDTDAGGVSATAYATEEDRRKRQLEIMRDAGFTHPGETFDEVWKAFVKLSGDFYYTFEQELTVEVPGRFAVASVIKNPTGRMFAEEARSDERGPFLQAWAIDIEDAKALHMSQEVVIHISDEAGEYCKIVSPKLPEI